MCLAEKRDDTTMARNKLSAAEIVEVMRKISAYCTLLHMEKVLKGFRLIVYIAFRGLEANVENGAKILDVSSCMPTTRANPDMTKAGNNVQARC